MDLFIFSRFLPAAQRLFEVFLPMNLTPELHLTIQHFTRLWSHRPHSTITRNVPRPRTRNENEMCIFIYTLPQLCRHPQFQNVCECAVARGTPETETSSLTLEEPKFLFDTSKSKPETPEYHTARFPCKKSKAIRPVLTMCTHCLKEQAATAKMRTTKREEVLMGGSSDGLGSSVGLVPASGSSFSNMTNGSGMWVSA